MIPVDICVGGLDAGGPFLHAPTDPEVQAQDMTQVVGILIPGCLFMSLPDVLSAPLLHCRPSPNAPGGITPCGFWHSTTICTKRKGGMHSEMSSNGKGSQAVGVGKN
ncbi:Hypothetical protein CBG03362 [Anopheles sinensis]|uniref:Uncharacterized protein n=1 Tax=Anopheles sinensis TaxID=74873 RepID=A0A084WGR4_ANOSI|nr:Hypothetical protein CBG03362 [Anopheles sinensis]